MDHITAFIMGIVGRIWAWLPDRCQQPDCSRMGLRGNENIIDGKLTCDFCHYKMMKRD